MRTCAPRIADQGIIDALRNAVSGPLLADLATLGMVTGERGQRSVRLIRHRELNQLVLCS